MNAIIVRNEKELQDNIEKYSVEPIYLVENNTIRKIIDNFKENNAGNAEEILRNLRIAYNVKFKGYLGKGANRIIVSTIKEVLDKTEDDNYKVIIRNVGDKKKDRKILSDVIQQFIFLRKSVEVLTEEDLRFMGIKKNFALLKKDLINSLNKFHISVLNYELTKYNKYLNELKKDMSSKIEEIKSLIDKTEARKLKIAVMATKKTGKSVIVNSILEEEFAPTSLELATPNSVVYEAWDKDYIEVQIDNTKEVKKFNSTKEVKNYLLSKFKQAEEDKDNNFTMPDVFIKYPTNKEYLKNLVVIDTPGPDLAGADHHLVADKWLKKSDVVLFAIDYTKYATESEIKFLEKVQRFLEEQGKFYSLIVTLNKVDQIFTGSANPSISSSLDFMKNRLKDISSKLETLNITATSSLTYFALLEYIKFVKKIDIIDLESYFNEDINKLLKEVEIKSLPSEIRQYRKILKDNLNGFEEFFYKEDVSVRDMIQFSGMDYLLNRLFYIAEKRAGEEVFNNIFSMIDMLFANLENDFIIKNSKNLRNKVEELKRELSALSNYFEDKKKSIDSLLNISSFRDKVSNIIADRFSELSKKMTDLLKDALEDEKMRIKIEREDSIDVEEIFRKMLSLENSNYFEIEISNMKIAINEEKEELLDKMEDTIKEINNDIKEYIKNKEFDKRYSLEINLSELDPKLAREEIEFKIEDVLDHVIGGLVFTKASLGVIETKTETYSKPRDGWFGWLGDWLFGEKEYTEKVKVVDYEKLDEEIEKLKNRLSRYLSKQIEELFEKIKKEASNEVEKFYLALKDALEKVVDGYIETNEKIKQSLEIDEETYREVLNFLEKVGKEFESFINQWKEIKKV